MVVYNKGRAGQAAANLFRVVVDCSLTLEQMIAAGHYDWKDPDITAKHFPIPPSKHGKEKVAIELKHFDRYMESKDVLSELDKMGFLPTELPELLAFGAAYPEKQCEFLIVALGSVWQFWRGRPAVACLSGDTIERHLILGNLGDGWDSSCRFAAVRKRK